MGQILGYGLGQHSLNQIAALLDVEGSVRALSQTPEDVKVLFRNYCGTADDSPPELYPSGGNSDGVLGGKYFGDDEDDDEDDQYLMQNGNHNHHNHNYYSVEYSDW